MSKNQGYIDTLYGLVDAVYIDFGVLDYHVTKYERTDATRNYCGA